jgi:hypothetical protein
MLAWLKANKMLILSVILNILGGTGIIPPVHVGSQPAPAPAPVGALKGG